MQIVNKINARNVCQEHSYYENDVQRSLNINWLVAQRFRMQGLTLFSF